MTDFRERVKGAANLLSLVLVAPLVVLFWLLRPISREEHLFAGFSQFLSLIPGLSGSYLRVAFYRCLMARCDTDNVIGFGSLFSHRGTELYGGIYIGPQCNIGLSVIYPNCLIGSGVHILSGKGQHRFDDPAIPLRLQGGEYRKISLGENSWVGNGALIMANVGRDCVIGAGTVVTHDIPAGSIVVGNPGVVVKSRYSDASQRSDP
ncbi:acyltransferase [Marinobacter sp. chi1]|uniref:Acyltransferase n=1 Tax=Marinobacter suaedae TaxID=3057675 RepID=A0ABT8W2Y6_9GAMM|nr:acyltransferase [Marinobacter sp. chi1]MDO3722589.1 acyltransferase [Marinobacter sp. chi1]